MLPKEIRYETWKENVIKYFHYLADNRAFVLNVFNSQNRKYLLRYFRQRLHYCIHGFAVIVAEGKNIEWSDLEFVCDFYANGTVGLISQWLDAGMPDADENMSERFYKILDNSVENLLARFQKD